MKKIILTFLLIMISFNLVSASFTLGNNSNIDTTYSPGALLTGYLNISFNNEPTNSLFSSSLGNISLIDLFKNNSITPNCNTNNCLDGYVGKNPASSKSFHLNYGEEKVISLGITTNSVISSINDLSLTINAVNNQTCLNPLEIDVLADGVIDWRSDRYSNSFSCVYQAGTGCFESGASLSPAIIDDNQPYCEKMNLIQNNKFRIGAWVKKNTNSTTWHNGLLKMYLYDLSGNQLSGCDLPQPSASGGEVTCDVNYTNNAISEYYVCLKGEDNSNLVGYETEIEDNNACGFYGYPGSQTENHDYYISAKAAKYDNIGTFSFNKDEYAKQNNANDLTQYVYDNLAFNNCSAGCSIPIKFKAKQNLDITLSNAKVDYSSGAGPGVSNLIYDTSLDKAKLTSGFLQLGINAAKMKAPSSFGTYNIAFYLNNTEILEKKITVIGIPNIKNIIPTSVPALVPVTFVANLENTTISNYSYYWDFGDGNTGSSTANKIEHSYTNIGTYQLKLTVKNNLGNASKTVNVSVVSPKQAINDTIIQYKADLINLKNQIDSLDAFTKKNIENVINVDNLTNELNQQEQNYNNASSDDEYITIMNNLLTLDIPQNVKSQQNNKLVFFQSPSQINLNALEVLGAGSIDETEDKYASSINLWLKNNMRINLNSKTYFLTYRNKDNANLFTDLNLEFIPNSTVSNFYIGINGDPKLVKFNGDYNTKDVDTSVVGVILPEISQTQNIEFLYPGRVDIANVPVFVSPEFKNLEFGFDASVCNSNNICEAANGENYTNCRIDCKPWKITLFLLIILFVGAFVIYIIMQEWYKRRYESHLFKNKTDLFNLINFMNNSLNQGLSKEEIFSKLEEKGWDREKLSYVWNKLNGRRTGMWEIPLFKWIENRKVKEEIEKRRGKPVYVPNYIDRDVNNYKG